ncbi:transposase [Streptomyces sp. NPDC056485]|uniref:transposase n=1 Tax=Streptomyces sp. NPDC056485 TaxID=3345834 RepID=UPI003673B241
MALISRRRCYTSTTTVAEWALLEPLLPVQGCTTKAGGRPEKWHRHEIVDAIRYIVDDGAKRRALLSDFHPGTWSTATSPAGCGPGSSASSMTGFAARSAPVSGDARGRSR